MLKGIINPQQQNMSDTDLLNIFDSIIRPHKKAKRPTASSATTAKSKPSAKPIIGDHVDHHLKSLATKIGIIPDANSIITNEERAMLVALDDLTMVESHLMKVAAVEAEEVEAECWNVAVLNQLIELSQKVGGIPFPIASDLYNVGPSGAPSTLKADSGPSGPSGDAFETTAPHEAGPSETAKGKQRADDERTDPEQHKRSIFNLHPHDAEKVWWSPSRNESGMFLFFQATN